MTAITIDIQPELLSQLEQESQQTGQPIGMIISKWLHERVANSVSHEHEVHQQLLTSAGLRTTLGPALQARAARSTASLEEVSAALHHDTAPALSEVVLAQRGLYE